MWSALKGTTSEHSGVNVGQAHKQEEVLGSGGSVQINPPLLLNTDSTSFKLWSEGQNLEKYRK